MTTGRDNVREEILNYLNWVQEVSDILDKADNRDALNIQIKQIHRLHFKAYMEILGEAGLLELTAEPI